MTNYIFFDTETNSGRGLADILSINALFCSPDFKIIEEFNCEARLRKSRIYEVDSFLVNGFDPFNVDKHPNSNFELTKKTNDKFISWINKGPVLFCAHNGYSFDYMLTSQHLYSNLFTWPWIFSTGNAKQIDSLPISQNFDFYSPNMLATELNAKNNKMFKLGSLAKMNGFEITELHTARGDTMGMKLLMELLHNKNPELFKKSISFTNKQDVLSKIKDVDYFCHPETFFGKTRQFTTSYLCEHPVYKGYHLCFDLKHDPSPYLIMSTQELASAMKKQPKFIRTVRHNKHPVIMNPSYGEKFDEYKMIGTAKLQTRAELIKTNKEFAEKIVSIKRSEVEEKEQTKSQEDLYNEESIYAKFTTTEDNKIMPEFHIVDWDKKLSVISKFKDERLQYFGKKLLYMEKPEMLTKSVYNTIHKDTAKKLLSTNNEKWNTIPRTYSEIDTLRVKFEKEEQPEKLVFLDEINAYVEELEKIYSSA